ncbi:hypothetical protein [Pseudomonas abietaniphila]|nr:hypothetical protein [Pseudomonas abietaniphila]
MEDNTTISTLWNAILRNQQAFPLALMTLADWLVKGRRLRMGLYDSGNGA